MMTTEDPGDATQAWYSSAFELAHLPRATTEQMRRQHHARRGGSCAGPHGSQPEPWPCSTWQLATTADRIRSRG